MPLPSIRLRAFTAADAPVVRRWAGAPQRFLQVADLLAGAAVPGTATWVAVDADDCLVAILPVAPEGSECEGMRSVALLVHPGRRAAGNGRATLLAALHEPCYAGGVFLAVIDRENLASLRCFAACGFAPDTQSTAGRYVRMICRAAQPGRQARGAISSSAALGPQVPAA